MDEKRGSVMGLGSEIDLKEKRKWRWKEMGVKAGLLLMVVGLVRNMLPVGRIREEIREFGNRSENQENDAVESWSWPQIRSSTSLIWYKCYERYDCARLEVPLVWLNPSDPRKAVIAMIRYNATDLADYKGPVFINPGGPGGSGVWFVKHLAPYYQSVVGKNHDIISFDPRGLGYTTPSINCWNNTIPTTPSILWDLSEPPVIDAHPGTLYDAYAHASASSQHCAQYNTEAGQHVNSASVARDMLYMLEKMGEEKLKYWGFSYGTFLGVTFASLFPDKVGRMVNDGNVDAEEYVSGAGTRFLTDADAVLSSFYNQCHSAGSKECAFYSSSPSAISTHLSALLHHIKSHPVIVPSSPSNPSPEIVTYSKLRKLIASALYRPLIMFPPLAEALAGLEKGDGRPFLSLTSQGITSLPLCEDRNEKPSDPTDPENPTPEVPEAEGSADASRAILCSDGRPVPDNVTMFGEYVSSLQVISLAAGATMASMRLACVGWSISSFSPFRGPFGGNTSNPILFIGNIADNVTPLRSAMENAKGFPGSRILVQESMGHTSLSCPSKCTAKVIRDYFQNGTLPEKGARCKGDLKPFEKWNFTIGVSEEDELDEALNKLMMAPVLEMH